MDYYGGEKSGPKKELNKGKVIKVSIAVFLIIIFVTLICLYEKNNKIRNFFDVYVFRKIVNEEKLANIEIDTSTSLSAFSYDRYIAILKQNQLKLYNKYGNEEHSIDIEVSIPLFDSNGNYLCVAEKGGNKIYLISNKNIVWQKEIEGEISGVSVNKNGYVSVTISGTSYKTVIQTFDYKGNELFKTYLSSTSVINTEISNDNKYLAVAEANFSGILVQSNIKIISIDDAKLGSDNSIKYTHLAKPNDLIINIKYNNKNDLVCMYDEHIDLLKGGENKELVNFKDENILFADINSQSRILEVNKKTQEDINSSMELRLINNNNGEISSTYDLMGTPKEVYVNENIIAINLGTNVLFINENGWLIKEYESKKDEIQNIIMCGEVAGVVSKNKISIISL